MAKSKKTPLCASLDDMLPIQAIYEGYSLSWWSPAAFVIDPVILYKRNDKHNEEVYRWNYIPNVIEVWEKIQELRAS